MTFNINDIKSPDFIKELKIEQLNSLCADIRSFILDNVSKTGGHLSSNLGSVEAIVAMHYCFSSPKDKFIFDVSHQAYTHKILTGRSKEFANLRKMNGLSGFCSYQESIHDIWESGHSSTSIAAAAGIIESGNSEGNVIVFIGDGSIQNGISFEALNYIGSEKKQKVIIILNDNSMSISKNVGRLARRFSKIRIRKSYTNFKKMVPRILKKNLIRLQNSLRGYVYGKNPFSALGYKYYGPIDGHNISEMIQYFEYAKKANDSLVIHIQTEKGRGYDYAINDKEGLWHGVGPFDPDSGKIYTKDSISWSDCLAEILSKKMEENDKITVICPATLTGSKLIDCKNKFQDRVIDCGINEELACVMASSMSRYNKIPIISIYSTFFQRCYDFLNNDCARQNNHVIFLLDRCGIIGGDGATHQGIFDIAMTSHIPNISIAMPMNNIEAKLLLDYAIKSNNPFIIRYPKENISKDDFIDNLDCLNINVDKWEILKEIKDVNIISYGPSLIKFKKYIENDNLNIGLINARMIKPFDLDALRLLNGKIVYIYEEVIRSGSLYSLLIDANIEYKLNIDFHFFGVENQFISDLGSKEDIKEKLKIREIDLIDKIKERLC